MIDEVGTEETRPNAPGADGDLFGDVADGTATADQAALEEDASEENAVQQEQGTGEAGQETGAQHDLRIVVSIKGDRAIIGVQRPSTDPHIESFDDRDLSGLAQEVLAVTERARAKWEGEPKHPPHTKPAPPAKRQTRREPNSSRAPASEALSDQQQPEALRLF